MSGEFQPFHILFLLSSNRKINSKKKIVVVIFVFYLISNYFMSDKYISKLISYSILLLPTNGAVLYGTVHLLSTDTDDFKKISDFFVCLLLHWNF